VGLDLVGIEHLLDSFQPDQRSGHVRPGFR
jgi:hypothetical protein